MEGLMDSKDFSTKNPVSVLQGDKFFFNRILSRESSVGCSSSRFYYRSAKGHVPFKWEMQPGKSKSPVGKEAPPPPPIRAPPAVLSLGLPKPCIDQQSDTNSSGVWFWKKDKISQLRKKVAGGIISQKKKKKKKKKNGGGRDLESRPAENSEVYNSDVEYSMDSKSHCGSSSSSSSSFSSSSIINGHNSLPSSRIHSPARDLIYGPFTCSPWNISAIMICVAKRV